MIRNLEILDGQALVAYMPLVYPYYDLPYSLYNCEGLREMVLYVF